MKAVDMLMELKMIEAGWRPTGFGYWMPTYTEQEWEQLAIETHAAQAEPHARMLANMPDRERDNRENTSTAQLRRA